MISLMELTQEWLDHAHDDLRSAVHLMSLQPVPCEVICFHCQQAAEKALKGFLIFHSNEPPRIHDLEVLCRACTDLGADFSAYLDSCKRMAPYSVAARYPNELELRLDEAKSAIIDATDILNYVTGLISEK